MTAIVLAFLKSRKSSSAAGSRHIYSTDLLYVETVGEFFLTSEVDMSLT
jgi:hypothetical protein